MVDKFCANGREEIESGELEEMISGWTPSDRGEWKSTWMLLTKMDRQLV